MNGSCRIWMIHVKHKWAMSCTSSRTLGRQGVRFRSWHSSCPMHLYTNESCRIWMSHVHIWKSHIMYEPVMCTYELHTSSCRTWMSQVTYEWVMSHMNESCHVWISHAYMKESYHAWTSPFYIWMTHGIMSHMNESSHIWVSHVTCEWVMAYRTESLVKDCLNQNHLSIHDFAQSVSLPRSLNLVNKFEFIYNVTIIMDVMLNLISLHNDGGNLDTSRKLEMNVWCKLRLLDSGLWTYPRVRVREEKLMSGFDLGVVHLRVVDLSKGACQRRKIDVGLWSWRCSSNTYVFDAHSPTEASLPPSWGNVMSCAQSWLRDYSTWNDAYKGPSGTM